jgi:hypothetical protein
MCRLRHRTFPRHKKSRISGAPQLVVDRLKIFLTPD